MHTGTNVIALPVEFHIAITRAEALDDVAWRAFGLVPDEQHVVPWVTEHGFQIVNDAAAGAHAVAGDNDGGPGAADQVVEDLLVVSVAVDGYQLLERQGLSAGLDAGLGFVVPVVFEFAVGLGEAAGQGGVEDDG